MSTSLSSSRRRHQARVLVAAVVASLPGAALAVTVTDWSVNSGDWDTGGNWSNGEPLIPGETAFITDQDAVNRTITYDYSGAAVTLGAVNVSNSGGGTNTLSMTTSGLVLTSSIESVGGYPTSLGLTFAGVGVLTQSAGTNNVLSTLYLGIVTGSTGSYTLSGTGSLASGGPEYVGYQSGTGNFNQSGGTNNITGYDSQLTSLGLGNFGGATGTYTLSGSGSVLSTAAGEVVGNTGAGVFIQTGGTNTGGDYLDLGESTGSSGSYTLSGTGSKLSIGFGESVGVQGTGLFNQSGGTNTTGAIGVAGSSGGTGTYNLSGTGAIVCNCNSVNDGGEVVGAGGVGTFNQTGGSNTVSGSFDPQLIIGAYDGSTGTYMLSGSGSVLSVEGSERIGAPFTGSAAGIFIQTGGTNTLTFGASLTVGGADGAPFSDNSTGSYTLSGSGSLLSVSGEEYVGAGGNGGVCAGTINQSGGTNTILGVDSLGVSLYVGDNLGSTGTYILSGTGQLSSAGQEYIGNTGAGVFTQTGGTNSLQADLILGEIAGSTGTYTLSGTGVLSVTGNDRIGVNGTGYFTQSGGTNTVSGNINVGFDSGALGSCELMGGTFGVGGNAYIGGQGSGPGGTGYLEVSGSGVLNVGKTLTVYNTSNTSVVLDGGTINTAALNVNGVPANFQWTFGTLGLTDGVTFDPSAASTSTSAAFGSSLNLQANQALNVTGDETLGGTSSFALTLGGFAGFYAASNTVTGGFLIVQSGSTYTIQNVADENPTLSTQDEEIIGYNGDGMFVQQGGTNTPGSGLFLGDALGSTGTYTLSGGVITGGAEQFVGYYGSGSFIQSAGTNTPIDLVIGTNPGSTGTYKLSGTGSLAVNVAEYVGQLGGDGTFIQSGGTNSAGALYIASNVASTGSYTLSGSGSVTIETEYVGFSGDGTFNQKGGTNTLSGYLYVGALSGATGTYNLSGGTLSAYVMSMLSPGLYSQTGGTATFGQITGNGKVSITSGTTTLSSGNAASTVTSLTVSSGGTLDVTNNRLVINYGSPGSDPVASIKAALTSGAAYNGTEATWTGAGITSSVAALSVSDPSLPEFGGKNYVVGYLDGNNTHDNLYGTVAANQIIVKYTVAGDAFLENSVGFRDLLIVAQDYQLTGKDYAQGNFYYNSAGSVGFSDLLAVAQSYGESFILSGSTDGGNILPLAWQSPVETSAVPEPASLSILIGAAGALLARRRRRF